MTRIMQVAYFTHFHTLYLFCSIIDLTISLDAPIARSVKLHNKRSGCTHAWHHETHAAQLGQSGKNSTPGD